jgi:trehalose 6-phosphate phosphatase
MPEVDAGMTGLLPKLPDRAALLLDLDGTLLDIAPTPDAVVVPPSLPPVLQALRARLGDALAIVTGRPVEQVEALLPGVAYAVAGEHGGAIRFGPEAALQRPDLPALPGHWLEAAERAVAAHPGALLEAKARGFAVHYRLAPDAGEPLRQALLAILDPQSHRLLPARMAWEVKPRGADKGTAVAALMARPPFAGRTPVYVGDDVTDEDGMREARAAGGFGFQVEEVFGGPAGVRAWLALQSLVGAPA